MAELLARIFGIDALACPVSGSSSLWLRGEAGGDLLSLVEQGHVQVSA